MKLEEDGIMVNPSILPKYDDPTLQALQSVESIPTPTAGSNVSNSMAVSPLLGGAKSSKVYKLQTPSFDVPSMEGLEEIKDLEKTLAEQEDQLEMENKEKESKRKAKKKKKAQEGELLENDNLQSMSPPRSK